MRIVGCMTLACVLFVATSAHAGEEGELGTVSVNCAGFAYTGVSVKWDSGKITREAACPPANVPGMMSFKTGERVKRVGKELVKVTASAQPQPPSPPKPQPTSPAPPKPASNKGTVTGMVVSVKLDDGTTREIRVPPENGAVKIGDKIEVSGSQVKPAR